MKRLLHGRSRRVGYDGWALKIKGAEKPLPWTACTTREECRQLYREELPWIRRDLEPVKVKIIVEVA